LLPTSCQHPLLVSSSLSTIIFTNNFVVFTLVRFHHQTLGTSNAFLLSLWTYSLHIITNNLSCAPKYLLGIILQSLQIPSLMLTLFLAFVFILRAQGWSYLFSFHQLIQVEFHLSGMGHCYEPYILWKKICGKE